MIIHRGYSYLFGAMLVAACATAATAGTISFSGTSAGNRPIAAEVKFNFVQIGSTGSYYLELCLRNTTANGDTKSPAETLTRVEFSVPGVTGSTLASRVGDLIFLSTETSTKGNIIKNSTLPDEDLANHWGLTESAGEMTLDWNSGQGPEYAIIGKDSVGDKTGGYPNANSGLVGDTHTPLVWYEACFRIDNTGFRADSTITDVMVYFNTSPQPIVTVPLPPAALMGLVTMFGIVVARARARRRRTA